MTIKTELAQTTATIILFPLLLVLKVIVVTMRYTFYALRFVIGVIACMPDVLRYVKNM